MVINDNIRQVKRLEAKKEAIAQLLRQQRRAGRFRSFVLGGHQSVPGQLQNLERSGHEESEASSSESTSQRREELRPPLLKKLQRSVSALYNNQVVDFRQRKLQFEEEQISNVIE